MSACVFIDLDHNIKMFCDHPDRPEPTNETAYMGFQTYIKMLDKIAVPLQQKELETLGRRATRQVDGLKIKEKKASENLTEADMKRRRLAYGIRRRAQQRKLDLQTARRRGVTKVRNSSSEIKKLKEELGLLKAEDSRCIFMIHIIYFSIF